MIVTLVSKRYLLYQVITTHDLTIINFVTLQRYTIYMVQLICWSNISNISSSIRSISIAEKFHVWTFSFFHVFVIAILHLLFIKREREIWSFEYNFKHIRDWEDFCYHAKSHLSRFSYCLSVLFCAHLKCHNFGD